MANTLYAIAIYVSFYFVGGKLNVTRKDLMKACLIPKEEFREE